MQGWKTTRRPETVEIATKSLQKGRGTLFSGILNNLYFQTRNSSLFGTHSLGSVQPDPTSPKEAATAFLQPCYGGVPTRPAATPPRPALIRHCFAAKHGPSRPRSCFLSCVLMCAGVSFAVSLVVLPFPCCFTYCLRNSRCGG